MTQRPGDGTVHSLQFVAALFGVLGGGLLAQGDTALVFVGAAGIFVSGLLNGFAAPDGVRDYVR